MSRFWLRQVVQLGVWGVFAGLNLFLGQHYWNGGFKPGLLIIAVGVNGGLWLASEGFRALVLRRNWLDRGLTGLAWRAPLAILALSVLVQVLVFLMLHAAAKAIDLGFPGSGDYRPGSVFVYTVNTAIMLSLWVLAWLGSQYFRRLRQAEIHRWRAEADSRRLELDALKARLNPHFMFNALNNLRALINEDRELARDAVTRLSNTLRYALYHSQKDRVSLAEEWAVVSDYLALEALHYEQRLAVEAAIPDDAGDLTLPPMLLQLLVENAIKHGVAERPGGGRIRIAAMRRDNALVLTVENPGTIREGQREHAGVGLKYLRSRLIDGLPGANFELKEQAGVVRAELEIPQCA